MLHLVFVSDSLDPQSVRALLARAGLSLPDDRLERLAPAIEAARETGRALAAIEMGYRGLPPFHPPEPPDG